MKERGILFSAPMVRAILAGQKSQTRRIVSPQPRQDGSAWLLPFPKKAGARVNHERIETFDKRTRVTTVVERTVPLEEWLLRFCPYGARGDRLYVKETWSHDPDAGANCDDHRCGIQGHVWYRATEDPDMASTFGGSARWRPSIFMPRWASRITLEVTEVRVQRLQEISDEDIVAEGAVLSMEDGTKPVSAFDGRPYFHMDALWAAGWDSINGKRAPWVSNPFVWAITFRRIEP